MIHFILPAFALSTMIGKNNRSPGPKMPLGLKAHVANVPFDPFAFKMSFSPLICSHADNALKDWHVGKGKIVSTLLEMILQKLQLCLPHVKGQHGVASISKVDAHFCLCAGMAFQLKAAFAHRRSGCLKAGCAFSCTQQYCATKL